MNSEFEGGGVCLDRVPKILSFPMLKTIAVR